MRKNYLEHPRHAHLPAELTSREVMKDAFSSMIKIVKNSNSYANVISAYMNKNMNADSSLKETYGNNSKRTNETSKNQVAEEVTSSSSSEDEAASSTLNNNDAATKSLLMHIFSILADNMPTLERLHYEISKHRLKENSMITYDLSLAPGRMMSYPSLPYGKSKSTNVRRSNMLKKIIKIDNSVNEDDCNSLACRILNMIDCKYDDEFFACIVKKAYCTKFAPIIIAFY